MKGTVNGKSLDQVLSELKAPFPEEELKKNEKNEESREKKVENNLPIEIKKENVFQKIIGFLKKIIKKSDGGY